MNRDKSELQFHFLERCMLYDYKYKVDTAFYSEVQNIKS